MTALLELALTERTPRPVEVAGTSSTWPGAPAWILAIGRAVGAAAGVGPVGFTPDALVSCAPAGWAPGRGGFFEGLLTSCSGSAGPRSCCRSVGRTTGMWSGGEEGGGGGRSWVAAGSLGRGGGAAGGGPLGPLGAGPVSGEGAVT